MAHMEQMEFVHKLRRRFPDRFVNKRVLEIGSLDINGTIRTLFNDCAYTGLDVGEGPGVDVVCQGQEYDAPASSYDVVICCEVMEHNPYWKETLANMFRLCAPGGLVIMTCASTGRKEHGTTRTSSVDSPLSIGIGWEYYRNLTAADFHAALDLSESLAPFGFFTDWNSSDLYLVGWRRGAAPPQGAARDMVRLAWTYRWINAGAVVAKLKRATLIALVGEKRYLAGPIRFW